MAAANAAAARRTPIRLQVRPRPQPETLTAYQLAEDQLFRLLNDQQIYGRSGDWVISRGEHVVDVLPEPIYRQRYMPAELDTLSLSGGDRTQIERRLGVGSTQTPQHLVTAVDRLARLSIGCIDVDFTPGQWEELAHRAQKRGVTVESLITRIVEKITADIWSVG